jgi:hypothetical protein
MVGSCGSRLSRSEVGGRPSAFGGRSLQSCKRPFLADNGSSPFANTVFNLFALFLGGDPRTSSKCPSVISNCVTAYFALSLQAHERAR